MATLSARTATPPVLLSLAALMLAVSAPSAYAKNTIGMGVSAIPKYQGSEDYRALPIPIINYHSGNFFISPRAGLPSAGLKMDLSENLSAGVFLGMGLGRKADISSHLDGMEDIKFHGAAGVFTEWRPGPFAIGAAYYQALRKGYGGTLELRASVLAWQDSANSLRLGVRTQWSNGDSMKTNFGVTQDEAAASRGRLHAYSPSAGFKSASVYGVLHHQLSDSWGISTLLGVTSLAGDAVDSPIVQERTSIFGNIGLTYSF